MKLEKKLESRTIIGKAREKLLKSTQPTWVHSRDIQ